ncbi:MAG: membrane integrity-associated transporter subunit PqiC [Chitinispirillaceae bacterium]|nr:membrane integrity-associated transporter subunit PqiC [Chitinispirillaceae bacterium]
MNRSSWCAITFVLLLSACLCGCIFSKVPPKQFYILNYLPSTVRDRLSPTPYPCTMRLRDFRIEDAYNRSQIVYRQSPYELRYYYYRLWAVKPARMITDLVYKHLLIVNLVSAVVRRFDEGAAPDYELTGIIEALDEYDSDDLLFAHVALRFTLSRISDGYTMYSRRFDLRKKVYEHKTENVIREMSSLMEFIMTQAVRDIDQRLAREYGAPPSTTGPGDALDPSVPDTTGEVR